MNNKKAGTEPVASNYFPSGVRTASGLKFSKFAKWSGIPPQDREPETESEFARLIGVSQEVLDTWKQDSAFSALVAESIMTWVQERTPEALGALYEKISTGDADGRDIEFFIRLGYPPIK